MSEWVWVERRALHQDDSYVRITRGGLYVSMRAEEMPWPRESVEVEVGFADRRLAIRRGPGGWRLSWRPSASRWTGAVLSVALVAEAERHGLREGMTLRARWDPESDMLVAEAEAPVGVQAGAS